MIKNDCYQYGIIHLEFLWIKTYFNNAFQICTNLFVLFWNKKCVIMKTTTSYCFAI